MDIAVVVEKIADDGCQATSYVPAHVDDERLIMPSTSVEAQVIGIVERAGWGLRVGRLCA
jgi:hypothetical protein